MIKLLSFVLFSFLDFYSFGQSYAPAAGQIGSTAIFKDSSIILGWANTCSVIRGLKQIDQPQNGYASFGLDWNGVGPAEGNSADIVSLGDGGSATLFFNPPIKNGYGPDFAVYENGFADHYMEFAFVEVSSNGIDFFRFPSVSETPLVPQMTNSTFGNCAYVHNLAGKYRQGFGTPFDLDDFDSIGFLNTNSITHIRVIDVVGAVNNIYGTMDFYGNLINDPWPTNFESSGFDLDAVAVLNQGEMNISEHKLTNFITPNPVNSILCINLLMAYIVQLKDMRGQLLYSESFVDKGQINFENFSSGWYFLTILTKHNQETIQIFKN